MAKTICDVLGEISDPVGSVGAKKGGQFGFCLAVGDDDVKINETRLRDGRREAAAVSASGGLRTKRLPIGPT